MTIEKGRDFGFHGFLAASFILLFWVAEPADATLAAGACVEFEDNAPVEIGSGSFQDSGVVMNLTDFRDLDGNVVPGVVRIEPAPAGVWNNTGGRNQYLRHINRALSYDFGREVVNLSILFAESAGNINLTINNDFQNTADLSDLDGRTVGGVQVEVFTGPTGLGLLRATGTVSSFVEMFPMSSSMEKLSL